MITVRRMSNTAGDTVATMTPEEFRTKFEGTDSLIARRIGEGRWEQVGVLDVKDGEEVLLVEPLAGG